MHGEMNIGNHATTTASLDNTRVKVPWLEELNVHTTYRRKDKMGEDEGENDDSHYEIRL